MRRKTLSSDFSKFLKINPPNLRTQTIVKSRLTIPAWMWNRKFFAPISDLIKNHKNVEKKRFPKRFVHSFFQKKRQKKAVFLAPLRLHLGASTKNTRKKHVFSSFLTKKFIASYLFTVFSQKQQKNAFFRLFFVDAPRRYIGGKKQLFFPPSLEFVDALR